MKRTIIMFSLIALACAACSDGNSGNKFDGRAWSTNLSERQEALERSIIADVLGGAAADTVIAAELSLAGVPPLDNEDVNENVVEDDLELEETSLEKSLTPVADSYEYPSVSGEGVLSITVSGNIEEYDVYKKEQRAIRFFPIKVTFSFENYDYVNSCGLPATISGNVSCKLQGELNRASDILTGNGSCMTGSGDMTGTVHYDLGPEEEHDLFLQASIVANGPWYELTSYQINGSYMLDRRTGNIDSIIAKAATACEE